MAAINAANTSVAVSNSTFFAPAPFPTSNYIRAWQDSRVLLSGCRFEASEVPRFLFSSTDSATIYSDGAETVAVQSGNGSATLSPALPVADIPVFPPNSSKAFLRRNDPWFVALLEARHPPTTTTLCTHMITHE